MPERVQESHSSTQRRLCRIHISLCRKRLSRIHMWEWTLPYDWMVISHVCRYWRTVSLAFPSTWSIFDTSCPSFARVCLERSKNAPLDIRIRSGCSEELLSMLVPHVVRFRTFYSAMTSEEHGVLFPYLAAASAQILEEITIDIPNAGRTAAPDYPPLFDYISPLLKRLSLSHFPIATLTSRLANLTYLDLRDDHPDSTPSMTAFLDFLQLSPNLEHMALHSAGPRQDEEGPERKVALNRLRHLSLSLCAIQLILMRLSLPHGVHIKAVIQVDSDVGVFAATFPKSLENLANMDRIEKFTFSQHNRNHVSLSGQGPSGSFTIQGKPTSSEESLTSVREAFLIRPPLQTAHILEFRVEGFGHNFGYMVKSNTITWVMRKLPRLDALVLLQCDSMKFLYALELEQDSDVLCPLLRSLTIIDDEALTPSFMFDLATARKLHGSPFGLFVTQIG